MRSLTGIPSVLSLAILSCSLALAQQSPQSAASASLAAESRPQSAALSYNLHMSDCENRWVALAPLTRGVGLDGRELRWSPSRLLGSGHKVSLSRSFDVSMPSARLAFDLRRKRRCSYLSYACQPDFLFPSL
jgi:hypothetical protein